MPTPQTYFGFGKQKFGDYFTDTEDYQDRVKRGYVPLDVALGRMQAESELDALDLARRNLDNQLLQAEQEDRLLKGIGSMDIGTQSGVEGMRRLLQENPRAAASPTVDRLIDAQRQINYWQQNTPEAITRRSAESKLARITDPYHRDRFKQAIAAGVDPDDAYADILEDQQQEEIDVYLSEKGVPLEGRPKRKTMAQAIQMVNDWQRQSQATENETKLRQQYLASGGTLDKWRAETVGEGGKFDPDKAASLFGRLKVKPSMSEADIRRYEDRLVEEEARLKSLKGSGVADEQEVAYQAAIVNHLRKRLGYEPEPEPKPEPPPAAAKAEEPAWKPVPGTRSGAKWRVVPNANAK